jgi:hypothetical protein
VPVLIDAIIAKSSVAPTYLDAPEAVANRKNNRQILSDARKI